MFRDSVSLVRPVSVLVEDDQHSPSSIIVPGSDGLASLYHVSKGEVSAYTVRKSWHNIPDRRVAE